METDVLILVASGRREERREGREELHSYISSFHLSFLFFCILVGSSRTDSQKKCKAHGKKDSWKKEGAKKDDQLLIRSIIFLLSFLTVQHEVL